jgi:hypothetical protein
MLKKTVEMKESICSFFYAPYARALKYFLLNTFLRVVIDEHGPAERISSL